MNKGLFIDIFNRDYASKLGFRSQSFRMIFEFLEAKTKSEYTIVETGCARQAENWLGDGQSSLMFDRFINHYDGIVYTVDIDPEACNFLKGQVSEKTQITCADSVPFLRALSQHSGVDIDLLYLDSYDLDWNNPHPASLHHLKELCAIIPALKPGTLIVVDDSVKTLGVIPQPDETDSMGYVGVRDMGVFGKGMYVDDFLIKIGCKRIIEGYQSGWILRGK
jgi:hypothetical protein